MKKTTFQLKNELKDFNTELETKRSTLLNAATNNEAETVTKLEGEIQGLETCRNTIQAELERRDADSAAAAAAVRNNEENIDPKEVEIRAMADFITDVVRTGDVRVETRAALGDKSNGGEKLLPKTVSNKLLSEPMQKNPLRALSTFTSITNLEIPTITFNVDGVPFLSDDKETSKEIAANGGIITFERNKFKIHVPVTETVLSGTHTNLVESVNAALESGLAAKEKAVVFADTKQGTCESFYASGIKTITGTSTYTAIKAAIADIDDAFQDNIKVVMTRAAYFDMIETLANGSATLYAAQPEQVLGVKVEFCDKASTPVVGDFSYSHFNYDPNVIYDRAKDVLTGIENFVITAWVDHKIKLKSAFRLVNVKPATATKA